MTINCNWVRIDQFQPILTEKTADSRFDLFRLKSVFKIAETSNLNT